MIRRNGAAMTRPWRFYASAMHAARLIKKSLKARKEILVDVAQFEVAKNIMNTGEIRMQMDPGQSQTSLFTRVSGDCGLFSLNGQRPDRAVPASPVAAGDLRPRTRIKRSLVVLW